MNKERTSACSPVEALQRAPAAERFRKYPVSWYLFCTLAELRRGPVSREFLGRRLVVFKTESGRLVAMDARCSHLGADLGRGRVTGEAIQCPFHHWEYGPDGRCRHIPAQADVPASARQRCYPVAERHGFVFLFNGKEPLFPLPFFPGCRPEELVAARPFTADLGCPWYTVCANAHDLQHFRATHDRRLLDEPVVDNPHPFARRATATFGVVGDSPQDRLTRLVGGPTVTLSFTDWCGTLGFTSARLRRTTSYGMVAVVPTDTGARVSVIVFARRSDNRFARTVFDPAQLAVRRYFIRRFLAEDAGLLNDVRYNPASLIDADRDLIDYFHWLSRVSNGQPQAATEKAGIGGLFDHPGDTPLISATHRDRS